MIQKFSALFLIDKSFVQRHSSVCHMGRLGDLFVMRRHVPLRATNIPALPLQQMRVDMSSQDNMPWSQEEIMICLRYFPQLDVIQKKLKFRSATSVHYKCRYLGLYGHYRHNWTMEEDLLLKELFSYCSWIHLLEAFPFATQSMLQNRANKIGIYRQHARRARKDDKTGSVSVNAADE
ncbi:hypothetical protein [Phyllobacterium sp. YR531]|uniref:hypothetical protein n=1 Tax=Phyllobacterium sp. YR531 TaxID=1144343 RepID=UPI0012F658FF|nr:hypothetical protein [Phyllobacterium sp. YR531]